MNIHGPLQRQRRQCSQENSKIPFGFCPGDEEGFMRELHVIKGQFGPIPSRIEIQSQFA